MGESEKSLVLYKPLSVCSNVHFTLNKVCLLIKGLINNISGFKKKKKNLNRISVLIRVYGVYFCKLCWTHFYFFLPWFYWTNLGVDFRCIRKSSYMFHLVTRLFLLPYRSKHGHSKITNMKWKKFKTHKCKKGFMCTSLHVCNYNPVIYCIVLLFPS